MRNPVNPLRRNVREAWARLRRSERGAAATEFSLVAIVLVYIFVNLIDVGMYVYDKIELQNAGQALMEKIFLYCPPGSGYTPVTTKCNNNLSSTIENTAVQNTSLGTKVTIVPITTATSDCVVGNTLKLCEGWMCVTTGGGLTDSGASIGTSNPASCANGNRPGDYIYATVTYTYAPVFSRLTVASLLTTPITYKAWMRVN
jgi:Flp pilus assembly protein TadG